MGANSGKTAEGTDDRGAGRGRLYDDITQTVGNTPCVKISESLCPPGRTIYAKLEYFNPMSSVKDRLACAIIEDAELKGQLKKGDTVVEATSGNTGIAIAMLCAQRGYKCVICMAEPFSIERRKLMRFLGAKVILTNPAHKGTGMLIKAKELADKHGWFLADQFTNEANAWTHAQTTGPEIVEVLPDLTDFFCAYGTGGTLKGVGSVLRERAPKTTIHVCEPDNAPMMHSGLGTEYQPDGRFKEPHPVWRPHLLQGWAADFIPKIVSEAKEAGYVDKLCHVGGDAAMAMARQLAQKEGIFSGTSGGGVLHCALDFAKTAPAGTKIVAMIPDTGERYLSTPLFADIPADMTPEEKELAASTPSEAPPGITMPPVTDESTAFVKANIKEAKVVVWSLEYCEFCWTIFALFKAIGVEYKVINIDAFEYAKDNMGNKYRSALAALTGCNTFPQCFINGEFFGGAADACIKWNKGELQPILKAAGIEYGDYKGDAFEFLPKWMTQNPLRSK